MTLKEWKELGFKEPCPIQVPGAEEITTHNKDYRFFTAAQKLRKQVADYLSISSDGWVPADAWDATQLRHWELYSSAVQAISSAEDSDDSDPVKSECDLKAIWPFDLQE